MALSFTTIDANQRALMMTVVIVSLLSVVLLAGMSMWMTRQLQPLKNVVRVAERVAEGDLEQEEFAVETTDEIGQVLEAMQRMVRYFREMASVANQIAQGDLSRRVQPRSERDVLGNAFRGMTDYFQEMADVADAIARGDLTSQVKPRSQEDVFGNSFRGMLENLSKMIGETRSGGDDAVVGLGASVFRGTELVGWDERAGCLGGGDDIELDADDGLNHPEREQQPGDGADCAQGRC